MIDGKLTRNAARCGECGETIESVHRHDFKWCLCRSLAVDGGLDYAKRNYHPEVPWEELSEYEETE